MDKKIHFILVQKVFITLSFHKELGSGSAENRIWISIEYACLETRARKKAWVRIRIKYFGQNYTIPYNIVNNMTTDFK
jgi:hypothetical protein